MFVDELAFRIQKIGKMLPQYELKELEAAKTNFIMMNRNDGFVYCNII